MLIHVWARSSKDLEGVADLIRRTRRDRGREVDVQLPEVRTGLASFRDPDDCSADVAGLIDKCQDAAKASGGYDEIILCASTLATLRSWERRFVAKTSRPVSCLEMADGKGGIHAAPHR